MKKLLSKEELISFEEKISRLYQDAKIRAPVHLSKNNEEELISIFKYVKEDDWIFSSYRNHYHALLKGIPAERLEKDIINGHSMHIMNKEHKFYSSSIVPGHLPAALGVALALKLKKSSNRVWAFCGDMAAETGVFHEITKYAEGHNLPITFIVESDGLGVYTPTKKVWGIEEFNEFQMRKQAVNPMSPKNLEESIQSGAKILKYEYGRGWPHHGIGLWVEIPEEEKLKKEKTGGLKYQDELGRAMKFLAEDNKTIFIGQTVGYKGSAIYGTLEGITQEKRIELPIMEEVQMGMSIGLSLEGYIPISIYPRFDFFILATNQIVNHLDKIKELSQGEFNPKVIIRTAVGSKFPFYPGLQHCQDHTEAYKKMLTNIDVIKLKNSKEIIPAYKKALENKKSTMLIELSDKYN